eukprot:1195500-Prorocentrum_minimum.AAC.23
MDISSSLSFQNFFPNSRSFFPTVGCAPAAPQLRSLPSSATAPPASVHRTDYCVRSPWCSPDGQDFVCVWEISSQKKGPVENLTALHGRGLEYSYRYSVVERRCRTKRETSCFGFLTARWAVHLCVFTGEHARPKLPCLEHILRSIGCFTSTRTEGAERRGASHFASGGAPSLAQQSYPPPPFPPSEPTRPPPNPPFSPPVPPDPPNLPPNPPLPPFRDPPYVAVGIYLLNIGTDDLYQGYVDLDFLLYTKVSSCHLVEFPDQQLSTNMSCLGHHQNAS